MPKSHLFDDPRMNVRKSTDYSALFEELDALLFENLLQTELYARIGEAICARSEKVAAVAAAAYLHERSPEAAGFSPRNVRRMRDFYRAYAAHPAVLREVVSFGWTLNVVVLESELSVEERLAYLRAAAREGWCKNELAKRIAAGELCEAADAFTADEQESDAENDSAETEHGRSAPVGKNRAEESDGSGDKERLPELPCQKIVFDSS